MKKKQSKASESIINEKSKHNKNVKSYNMGRRRANTSKNT